MVVMLCKDDLVEDVGLYRSTYYDRGFSYPSMSNISATFCAGYVSSYRDWYGLNLIRYSDSGQAVSPTRMDST